jgi:hypothetical protein
MQHKVIIIIESNRRIIKEILPFLKPLSFTVKLKLAVAAP